MNIDEALKILKGMTEEQAVATVDNMGDPDIMLKAYDILEAENRFKPEPIKPVIPITTKPAIAKPIQSETDEEPDEYTEEEKNKLREAYLKERSELRDFLIKNPAIKEKINSIILAWREARTKEQFLEENKDFFEEIKGNTGFAPMPKKERAEFIYSLKQNYPKVSVSVICHAFDVSESVFRTERLIHGDEWKQGSINHIKNNIFDIVSYAKDQRIEALNEEFPGLDLTPILKLFSSS